MRSTGQLVRGAALGALAVLVACAGESFVAGEGGSTTTPATTTSAHPSGGAAPTTSSSSTGHAGGAGGAIAAGGGGSISAGGAGGAATTKTCGACKNGEVCDLATSDCVGAAYLRALGPTAGEVCVYHDGGASLSAHFPVPGGYAAPTYQPVAPGDLLVSRFDGACPTSLTVAQKAAASKLTLGFPKLGTYVEAAKGHAAFVDAEPGSPPDPAHARYVDVLAGAPYAPLDFSSTSQNVAPIRVQSGGVPQPGIGPDPNKAYVDLDTTYAPSPANPVVLSAHAPQLFFLPSALPLTGATFTLFALPAGAGTHRVMLCRDATVTAPCVDLLRPSDLPSPFPYAGLVAPSVCMECGVRSVGATYDTAGKIVGGSLAPDAACACAAGHPTWTRCLGGSTDCAGYCKNVMKRGCAAQCESIACSKKNQGEEILSSDGPNPGCVESGACGKPVATTCGAGHSTYCCCS